MAGSNRKRRYKGKVSFMVMFHWNLESKPNKNDTVSIPGFKESPS